MLTAASDVVVGEESGVAFLCLVFSLLGGVVIAWDVSKQWRGKKSFCDGPRPPAWPFGPAFWHGCRRTTGLLAAFVLLAFVPLFLAGVMGGSEDDPWFLVPGFFGGGAFFVIYALMASVHLFNWPKWPVPPHRRAEPGAVIEWRDAIRRLRSERRERHSGGAAG